MVPRFSGIFIGVVLVVGTIVVPASVLSGEERRHPSLVDPATTKCTVCHMNVGGPTHTEAISSRICLSCHTFVMRSKKTFLIVEDSQQSRDVDAVQVPVKTGAGVALARPTPPAAVPPPAGPPEGQDPVIVSGDGDDSGDLYAEGMTAFNRAEFDRAYDTWRLMLTDKPDHFALQIEVDTYFVSVQSTIARYGDHSLYVVKKDDLYWVFSGLFATRAKAIEALKLLPEPLRRNGAFPVAVRQILLQ